MFWASTPPPLILSVRLTIAHQQWRNATEPSKWLHHTDLLKWWNCINVSQNPFLCRFFGKCFQSFLSLVPATFGQWIWWRPVCTNKQFAIQWQCHWNWRSKNDQLQSHTHLRAICRFTLSMLAEVGELPQGGVWPQQKVFQCFSKAHPQKVPHTATGNLISGRPSSQVDYLLCLEVVQEACVGPSILAALRLCTSPHSEPDSQCSVQTNTPTLSSPPFKCISRNSSFNHRVDGSNIIITAPCLSFFSDWSRFRGRYRDGEVLQHQMSCLWPAAWRCGSGCHHPCTEDAWRRAKRESKFPCLDELLCTFCKCQKYDSCDWTAGFSHKKAISGQPEMSLTANRPCRRLRNKLNYTNWRLIELNEQLSLVIIVFYCLWTGRQAERDKPSRCLFHYKWLG